MKDISHIPENYILSLKTKFRNTCEKDKIFVPDKYKKVINQLSRNKDLCIFKQDKGRSVALIDRTKYINKCLEKLKHDPTKSVERYNSY